MSLRFDPPTPPSDDDYFMGVALAVRRKANCKGNRVAAVIVKDKRIIATGYNGVPAGMPNCLDGGCLRCQNPNGRFPSGTGYDLCICVHAEQNAILSAYLTVLMPLWIVRPLWSFVTRRPERS